MEIGLCLPCVSVAICRCARNFDSFLQESIKVDFNRLKKLVKTDNIYYVSFRT